jgi:hypothetical protein
VHVANFASPIRTWSIVLYYARAFQHATETEDNLSVKMFIIYLSLILMKTNLLRRRQKLTKEEILKKKKFGIKNA